MIVFPAGKSLVDVSRTTLMEMFFVIEIVSFLYAILMSAGNAQSSSPTLPEATINLIIEALCMLNFMGTVDLKVLQVSGHGLHLFLY